MRYFLSTLTMLTVLVGARAADDLDMKLRENASKIVDFLQKKDCKNVGVLKFLVDPGDGTLSDNAGELNMGLANRLEVALVLALKDDSMGIITQATEVAAKIRGANHLDEEGRQKCFRRPYVLAWGDPAHRVKAGMFLTGQAVLAKDLKSITVKIQAFGPDGKLEDNVCSFTAKTGVRILADTGHNYLLTAKSHPDLFKGGARGFDEEQLAKPAVDTSQQYQSTSASRVDPPVTPPPPPPPAIDRAGPIKVTVLYNGKPVEVKNGRVPEPTRNDVVSFELVNDSDEVHGVVFKVNGENTLFRERLDDRDCFKWILKPKQKAKVFGFQTSMNKREDFVVLPPDPTGANEVRYGPLLGTFQISAFRGKLVDKDDEPALVLNTEKQSLLSISRGSLLIGKIEAGSLRALQADLRGRETGKEDSKGIVDSDSDNPKDHDVEKVIFKADPPIAVMLYQIRYYDAKRGK